MPETYGVLPFTLVSGLALVVCCGGVLFSLGGLAALVSMDYRSTLDSFGRVILGLIIVGIGLAAVLVGFVAFVAVLLGLTGLFIIFLLSDFWIFIGFMAVITLLGILAPPTATATYIIAYPWVVVVFGLRD